TFRSLDVDRVVPGHLVTLRIENRWPWKDHEYASGQIESPRIAVDQIGLEPLPLRGGELLDLREHYEPFREPEPYVELWERLTDRPRPDFKMDPIAWGAFPGAEYDDNPTCDATELVEAGREDEARELLMETACRDLRCIDAHALLGNLEFDEDPERAMLHYEVGMRIGELSLPAGFDGLLLWGHIYNRPFLRCLHGYGLCLWRLRRPREALAVFERMLSLNPNDNQGMRGCQQAILRGLPWESLGEREELYH
ncbi:MAG: tetratricopeptide repeat protein, partial [Myxococcota bacterium]